MANFDRYLANLHPSVRKQMKAFLEEAAAAGLDPRVQEAFRTKERQNELYAQGRSKPGAIVTKARGGQSIHNYGAAADIVPGSLLSQKNWAPESPLWGQLGAIGKKHGLEWGGDWKFVDKPHFQLSGANWRTLQNDPQYANFMGGGGTDTMMGGTSSPPPAPPAQEIGGDSLVPRQYPGMTPSNTFGTMAPQPQPSDNLAASATNGAMGGMSPDEARAIGGMIGDKKKSAWDHFTAAGEAFDQVMPAPRISGGGGDARATGNALTDFLNNMGGLEEGLIKRRLGFLGL